MQSQPFDSSTGDRSASVRPARRPAAIAAGRAARAEALLGMLGLASFGLVLLRLVETWRVSPQRVSHQVAILGQTLSYPAANMAAVIVLVLAVLGAVVTARAVQGVAREVTGARRFHRRLAPATRRDLGGALVIDDDRPHAFCAGLLWPRVYVTSGALAILDESALKAVLAHERHHARRRDPLRLATSRVLARAMFFLPALRELGRGQQTLAEMSADESAIDAEPGNRAALARAMLSFSDASDADDSVGIDPARVDYLLGEPPRWRFPAMLCLAAIGLLALIVTTAVLVGREAAGTATLAPPFLSAQPCVVVLASIPAAFGLVAVRLLRRG
ncbi:MAG TPA: M56 family metallopeptidase [Solirubrobacteraceae bacterium]|nr:M56 family metallopeptidase [Solirubrobacteraceae bacterium]